MAPGGSWRLILEAIQVQIERSHLGMLSCMSKYRFFGVRISNLISKIMSSTRRLLEADPGGLPWPGRGRKVTLCYAFMYV